MNDVEIHLDELVIPAVMRDYVVARNKHGPGSWRARLDVTSTDAAVRRAVLNGRAFKVKIDGVLYAVIRKDSKPFNERLITVNIDGADGTLPAG